MNKKWIFVCFLSGLVFLNSSIAQAGWKDALLSSLKLSKETSVGETQIGKALKEALHVGIDQAVKQASEKGGYSNNELIKIKFPEKLSWVETTLRKVGMGSKIDDFEARVNRAAEEAAPQAKEVLVDTLLKMNIQDAENLLHGGDTAATDYFRDKTWDQLHERFSKKIQSSLSQYQVSQKYDQLISAYQAIPLSKKPEMVSASDYATDQALEGLFTLIGQQEKKIRQDPAARVTELLQKVFANT